MELRKDIIFTPERRKKIGENSRKVRLRTTFPQKETSIEKVLYDAINEYHIPYEKHLTVCDICQPDMIFTNLKIAVFADGDYWHSGTFKDGRTWEKDRNQDRVLSDNGWKVLRFWGSEINRNPRICVVKIMETIYERCYNNSLHDDATHQNQVHGDSAHGDDVDYLRRD